MKAQHIVAGALGFVIPLLCGCDLPGRPKPGPEVSRPEAVMVFDTLYGQNCAGCHGANGQNGAATDLENPEYEALIDDASLRDWIANGEKGTLMPGFSTRAGGNLTDAQIEAIMRGMRSRWSKENAFAGETPPPYKAALSGDIAKGRLVYAEACARCHGAVGQKTGQAGSILDGSFLALINEQTVRTTIIAGRPDIGEPDWRGHIQGRPMTDQEITEVCAWLVAQKAATPGQPYPNAKPASEVPGEARPQATKSNDR